MVPKSPRQGARPRPSSVQLRPGWRAGLGTGRAAPSSLSPSAGLEIRERPPPPAPRGLPEALQVERPDPAGSPPTLGPWATSPPCPHPGLGGASQRPAVPMATRWTQRRALGAQSAGWLSPLREAGQVGAPGRWARAGEADRLLGRGGGGPGGFWKAQEGVGLGARPGHRAAPSWNSLPAPPQFSSPETAGD